MAACREKGDDELPSVPSGNDTTEGGKDNARIKEIDLLSGNNGYVIEAGASQIVAEEALYEWKITKDSEEIAVGFGNVAELKRNATYQFELLYRVDGETEKIFPIEIVGSDLTGLVIDNDTGLVTIGAEREAGDSFTLGGTANDGTVYSYTLTVIPI